MDFISYFLIGKAIIKSNTQAVIILGGDAKYIFVLLITIVEPELIEERKIVLFCSYSDDSILATLELNIRQKNNLYNLRY